MNPFRLLAVVLLLVPVATTAATLSVTPDQTVYQVGDMITLNVLGDAEGAAAQGVFGRLTFDGDLAGYVSSNQILLESGSGGWDDFGGLGGGVGFADAFNQITTPAFTFRVPTNLLVATVVLEATAVGELAVSWESGSLMFFGLLSAPGATVSIIPEPDTSTLVGLGLLLMALRSRQGLHHGARRRRTLPAAVAVALFAGPASGTSASDVCVEFLDQHLGDPDWRDSCLQAMSPGTLALSSLMEPSSAASSSSSMAALGAGVWNVGADDDFARAAGNQNEISLVADPSGSGRVFVIAMTAPEGFVGNDDRNGFFAAMSENHGTTWRSMIVADGPGLESPQGAFDPWAAFSEEGTLFITYLNEKDVDESASFPLPAGSQSVIVSMWNENTEAFD